MLFLTIGINKISVFKAEFYRKNWFVFILIITGISMFLSSCQKPVMLEQIKTMETSHHNEYQLAVMIGEYVFLYPNDLLQQERFIQLLFEKGFVRESLHLCEKILQNDSLNPTALFYSALAYSSLCRFTDAEAAFGILLSKYSSNKKYEDAYGKFSLRKQSFQHIASLDSLCLTDSTGLYLKERGNAFLFINELASALSDYRYFLSRFPPDPDILLNKMRAEILSSQYDSAMATALMLKKLQPENTVFSRFEELVSQFREAEDKIRKQPRSPQGYIEKARICLLLRLDEVAIDNLLTALSLNPNDHSIRYRLALTYITAGQNDKAGEIINEMEALGIKLPDELRKRINH